MHQTRWVSVLKAVAVAGLATVLPSALSAQTGKVAGTVTEAQSGQPIEGVQIILQGTGIGALTSSNGRFFIISVPPGTYTVTARRIGYQQVDQTGVAVRIDATREVNFTLTSAAGVLAVTRIEAPPVPLVERGITGSSAAITAETMEALPVTSISGVLALQQGFFEVPQNTDITSFTDTRRNVLSPIRIRGGRQGETLTLIDGIPVNNVVFGDRAFDITNTAVQQIDYQKGGFEPQYGNALSGIINLATKEGGARLAGNVEYQSTALGGSLGSGADEVRGFDLLRGYLSGPVPGTSSKVRFMVAGQTQSGADRVLEFDQDINSSTRTNTRAIQTLDLYPGFRAFGYDSERDIFGKLTFNITSSSKLNLSVIDYERQRLPFDFDFAFAGYDPLKAPVIRTLEDSLRVDDPFRKPQDVAQGSIRASRQLYSASFEQRFGRSNLRVRGAQFNQQRQTCNFFQGICLGNNFQDLNFTESFVYPVTKPVIPGNTPTGSDIFFGGEKVRTSIVRGDLETQATDHHNLQAGVFWQRHDINFAEARNLGINAVLVVPLAYKAVPFDAAMYIQDRIEYDFLTVKLGFRYDYGKAVGSFFKNPLDPTNGTTARDVCLGQAPSLGATVEFTGTDNVTGAPLAGLAACTNQNQPKIGTRAKLLDSATRIAQRDDFAEADARRAFSPRIGVSFPLAERSALFFNAGRYSQNPLYNNLYQNTNVGLTAGNGCSSTDQIMEQPNGSCSPTIYADAYQTAFLGNTNLALEQTTSYEVGYASEVGRHYAVRVTLFSKDQTGLSGVRQSDRTVQDIGATYGSGSPRYNVIINQDYGTSRGIELQFQRRLSSFWGYDINYSFSKATTNSPPPEAAQQRNAEGDPTSRREITSEIDLPHSFNAALFFRADKQAPNIRFGSLLRHSYLTLTTRAASGVPYTPITDFANETNLTQLDVNSARSPTTMQTDAMLGKDLQLSNLRYGLFLRVVNLFDRKNCLQVFVSTGRCDAGAPDQDRAQQGNPVNEQASTSFFDRAGYFGDRRSIYAGVRLDF